MLFICSFHFGYVSTHKHLAHKKKNNGVGLAVDASFKYIKIRQIMEEAVNFGGAAIHVETGDQLNT